VPLMKSSCLGYDAVKSGTGLVTSRHYVHLKQWQTSFGLQDVISHDIACFMFFYNSA
jgi:hypothetical protein